MKREGRSAQHIETSMIDCGVRKEGGKVILARSPLTIARNCAPFGSINNFGFWESAEVLE
jgi:hypothetical protein